MLLADNAMEFHIQKEMKLLQLDQLPLKKIRSQLNFSNQLLLPQIPMELPEKQWEHCSVVAEQKEQCRVVADKNQIEQEQQTPRAANIEGAFKAEPIRIGAFFDEESSKCDSEEEEELLIKRCRKIHACGHRCSGVSGEEECLPCLVEECHDEESRLPSAEELCTICWTTELETEACVQLGCGHVFHANCVLKLLQHRWSTLKISFAFMSCPSCKQSITENRCLEIQTELASLAKLRVQIEKLALEVAENQGLSKDERLMQPGGHYEGKLLELAMHTCAFYQCYDCEKPYFGGMIDCQLQLGVEEHAKKENLRCKACQMKAYGAGQQDCEKHGKQQIDWKCMYCCSVALWHCFGTHYFCDRCHNEYCQPPYNQVELRDCNGVNCPLGVPHPPASSDHTKSTFPLGCGLCRSDRLAEMKENDFLVQEVSMEPVVWDANKEREEHRRQQAQRALEARRERQRLNEDRRMRNRQVAAVDQEKKRLILERRERAMRMRKEANAQQEEQKAAMERKVFEEAKQNRDRVVAARQARAAQQSVRANKILLDNKQKFAEAQAAKAAAVDAKMARIDKLKAVDAKSAAADRKQKLKELAERQKLLRQSLKARPQTAQVKDNAARAFI